VRDGAVDGDGRREGRRERRERRAHGGVGREEARAPGREA
jgi:hypothetical protein